MSKKKLSLKVLRPTKFLWLICLLVLALCQPACSGNSVIPKKDPAPVPDGVTAEGFPLTITDFAGREVTIDQPPQKVVSLSPGNTEILFKLGFGSRVSGVTAYDDFPPEVKDIPRVGGFRGPSLETIVQLKPDLIFASYLSGRELLENLEKIGLPVVMVEAANLEEIYQAISLTAAIMGSSAAGQRLVDDIKEKIAGISDKIQDLPRVPVFYLIDINGFWTAGKGTFIDELITLGGGSNIAGEEKEWVQYSREKIVEKNPAVILAAPHAGDTALLQKEPGFKDTLAVREGKIFLISDDNIITRPSHRIVEGLAEVAQILHPEAFEEK